MRIFNLAADAFAAAEGVTRIETVVVIDRESFERELHDIAGSTRPPRTAPTDLERTADDLAGDDPSLLDDLQTDHEADAPDLDGDLEGLQDDEHQADDGAVGAAAGADVSGTDASQPAAHAGSAFRCETIDGFPLDPTEVVANALVNGFRRAVFDSRSVVIDLGSRQRLYRAYAQMAVKLSRTTCYWPGCNVPVSQCQSDHLTGWKAGGKTNPGNGAPACGRHNRHKEHGFTVRRDTRGRLHVHRPDGTEIT